MQDSKVCSVFWFESLAYPASSTITDFARHRKVDSSDVSPCNIVERTPGSGRLYFIFFEIEHGINPSPILPQVFFPNHEQSLFWFCCWYLRIDITIVKEQMYKNMSDSSLDDGTGKLLTVFRLNFIVPIRIVAFRGIPIPQKRSKFLEGWKTAIGQGGLSNHLFGQDDMVESEVFGVVVEEGRDRSFVDVSHRQNIDLVIRSRQQVEIGNMIVRLYEPRG
mmetsp:Transcript_10629/g.26835  ORF Transcript_10629/g.26835 Transcript_10629/m.26835 type:complete len:220 (-) Transcript_10629:724-1383(-)